MHTRVMVSVALVVGGGVLVVVVRVEGKGAGKAIKQKVPGTGRPHTP